MARTSPIVTGGGSTLAENALYGIITPGAVGGGFCQNELILEFPTKSMPSSFRAAVLDNLQPGVMFKFPLRRPPGHSPTDRSKSRQHRKVRSHGLPRPGGASGPERRGPS